MAFYSLFLLVIHLFIYSFSNKVITPQCGYQNSLPFHQSSDSFESNIPLNLCVPTLAYDQTTVTLVWNKPNNYSNIIDYNIYMNGELIGGAKENNFKNSPAFPYINLFYNEDKFNFHTKITYHSFLVKNLEPNKIYSFTVRSVDENGNESKDSAEVVHQTAPNYKKVFDVSKLGAKGDGKTLNTKIIQNAIDKCSNNSKSPFDCKILISADKCGRIFLSGALYLRSNMTFEIANGTILRGSSSFVDYPLIKNVVAALLYGIDHIKNVRIIGFGTIDGQGWQSSSDTIDELGNNLAYYENSYFSTWNLTGILARSQMQAAVDRANGNISSTDLSNAYASVRSSLITFYAATNIFVGNIRLINPAYHGIRFLLSRNVVCAYTRTETYNINNADGIQSQSINTIIFNNFLNSGDDCVVFKAGQGQAVENFPPTQYGWVFNNFMREGHGVVVLGSETGSWIKEILAEDNVAFLTENGMRVKSTAQTGGGCQNFYFRDSAMREIGTKNIIEINGHLFNRSNVIYQSGSQCAFVLSMTYSLGSTNWVRAKTPSYFLDINVKSVTVDNGNTATGGPMISVTGYSGNISLGYPETFSKNVTFENIKIIRARPANISRLQDSLFKNILIEDWGNFQSPWILNNTENLKFVNVQPMPN
ncbi:hypothetical protein ACQ4LE_009985 [Meloidogyne hapla]|uniref:Fibronectin type-III domain-containing protein n=1 Tax=Meloidogyne hapla TaxID=6305 RepID=A0A1I8BD40_MELHA